VRLSVCLFVMFVSAAKTAELIEMPIGRSTRVGTRNYVLDGVEITHGKGQFLGLFGPLKTLAAKNQ